MTKSTILSTLLGTSLVCGLSASWASEKDLSETTRVLRGQLVVQNQKGDWQPTSFVSVGKWVRSEGADTTVQVPGMTLRLEPGAKIRLNSAKDGASQLDTSTGRVFVRVDSSQVCTVAAQARQVQACKAEFVLDADNADQVYMVGGDAQVIDTPVPVEQKVKAWRRSSRLALDGPDVRQRNKNKRRKKFVQGEENKGKKLVEEPTPQPSMTQTPAYTPTPPPVQPPVPPTPPTPPPTVTGGSIWPVVGGLVGLGGIIALVTRGGGTENPVRPASP